MATLKRQNGTSCHQCKNIKADNALAFCTNFLEKRSKNQQRARKCLKKYCHICLTKFYNVKDLPKTGPNSKCAPSPLSSLLAPLSSPLEPRPHLARFLVSLTYII
jgi:hypothetical protein